MRGSAWTIWIVAWCGICLLGTPALGGEPSFPYTAEVSVDEVEVRCGPDWEYYATHHLRRGTKVDVYRHEPGGWLAIRPPAGSFSWIPARQVKRGAEQGVGEVTIDAAVAWVGSALVDVTQHKWQVRLQQGELVEILGEKPLSVGPGFATETYLQIAPPAGEFRWIHAENAVAPGAVARRSSTRTIQLTDYASGTGAAVPPSSGDSPAGIRLSPTSIAQQGNTAAGAAPAKDEREMAQLIEQVEQLKVDLSLLVTRQIDQWDLDALRARTDTLAAATDRTPLSQDVRLISYRINEFEALRKRYQRLSQPGTVEVDPQVERHGVSAAPAVERTSWQEEIEAALTTDAAVGTGVDASTPPALDPRFDAEGWLMPVHSTRRVAPPFALLDDDGRVLCYVTPTPGLNLRRYTKKYVGVFGERQFVSDLRASLITVSRIVKQK